MSEIMTLDPEVKHIIALLKDREKSFSLTEERLNEIKEWIKENNIYNHFEQIIAPEILNQDLLKTLSTLALFTVQRPLYVLVISDPAVAKSQVALWLQKRTPITRFVEGTKLTSAGLTMTKMGKKVIVGALPDTHMGTLFLDELDKTPRSEAPALYSSMANHEFSVTKATLTVAHVPSRQSGVFYCNPKGERFISKHPKLIKQQIPFSSVAFLTRFHISLCLFAYEIQEFSNVTRHQYKTVTGKVKQSIIDDNLKLWKDYVQYARNYILEWRPNKRIEDLITIFSTEIYRQNEYLALPISARLNEGVIALSEAFARSRLDTHIRVFHVIKAIQLMLECLEKVGLDKRPVIMEIKKYAKKLKE